MDKIPFEEWALKSIDPPSISSKIRPAEGPRDKSQTGSTTESEEKIQAITLIYPGSLCVERELMSGLQRAMAEHEPYHRKWMKMNIFLSPLTLPCAIVPLVPNLPFFLHDVEIMESLESLQSLAISEPDDCVGTRASTPLTDPRQPLCRRRKERSHRDRSKATQ